MAIIEIKKVPTSEDRKNINRDAEFINFKSTIESQLNKDKYIEDVQGNKYVQIIENGKVALKLIEDSKGLMYE